MRWLASLIFVVVVAFASPAQAPRLVPLPVAPALTQIGFELGNGPHDILDLPSGVVLVDAGEDQLVRTG
jgi:hypothetical protein